MSNTETLKYKGYLGSIVPSLEDGCLVGEVLFIRDTIIYEGESLKELQESFKYVVDQYLADCKTLGREPNKTFSGTFNVRVGPERHKALACLAYKLGKSNNQILCDAIDAHMDHHSSIEETAWKAELQRTEKSQPHEAIPVSFKLINGGLA